MFGAETTPKPLEIFKSYNLLETLHSLGGAAGFSIDKYVNVTSSFIVSLSESIVIGANSREVWKGSSSTVSPTWYMIIRRLIFIGQIIISKRYQSRYFSTRHSTSQNDESCLYASDLTKSSN